MHGLNSGWSEKLRRLGSRIGLVAPRSWWCSMPGLHSLMILMATAKSLTRVLIHGNCSRSSLGFAWADFDDDHCFAIMTANEIIGSSCFADFAIRH